jgi:hypothetical protein
MKTFFTASELSRELGLPSSRIISGVESGLIEADGRAGSSRNSPLIFNADRIESIRAALTADRPAVTRLISPFK